MNILSIDFDWIMAPSIQSYNSLSRPQVNWTYNTWRNIEFEIPANNFQFDPEKYYQLLHIIQQFKLDCKDLDYIYTGLDHHTILEACNFWQLPQDESYILCNIDHHHDCGYCMDTEPYLTTIQQQGASLSNWVYYFCEKYKTTNYIWVKNQNSLMPMDDTFLPQDTLILPSSDLTVINKIKFDRLFICLSPDWVPPKYYPLYNVIEDLIRLRPFDFINKK